MLEDEKEVKHLLKVKIKILLDSSKEKHIYIILLGVYGVFLAVGQVLTIKSLFI